MRMKTLLSMALAGLLMVLVVPRASAERVKTTQSTKVMKRPGEEEVVVTRVPKGRTLTVIAHEGRWMKVRVNGRTGWIARSTVSAEAREEIPRNTRRHPFVDGRSTRRGWSGEAPDDRVGEDAVDTDSDDADSDDGDSDEDRPAPKPHKKPKKVHHAAPAADDDEDSDDADSDDGDADSDDESASDDCDGDDCDEDAAPAKPAPVIVQVAVAKTKLRAKPSKKAKGGTRVKRGAALTVIDEQKDWMLVENNDGDQGWIKKSEIVQPGRPARQITLDARVGFERMSQLFASDGTGTLGSYAIAAMSGNASVRADYVQKKGPKYLIGAEARLDIGKSTPGIRYQTDTQAVDIPYTTYDVDARALAGYDFHNKMGAAAFARLGYHYGMFQVANVGDFTKNLAHLPSETLAGFEVGVGADLPKLTDKLGASINADYLLMGKRAQTKGLEDGAVSTAKGAWAGLTLAYQWKKDTTLSAAYNYEYAKTVWTGAAPASMRGTNSTTAARKDTSHALFVGLAKSW